MTPPRPLKIAAAQYDIGELAGFAAYARKLSGWVSDAARSGARLLVFPEYGAMELVSLFGETIRRDLAAQLDALQTVLPDFLALHQGLAAAHGVYICAASFPVRVADGAYRNRAHVFAPPGVLGFQDKLIMTRFESERWHIGAGAVMRVFETELGCFGVNLCYDSEFPLIARAQIEAGAQFILVPSCTDSLAGYHRVRIACQARALENQCYVIQSVTVGAAAWSEAVDVNVGAAAVLTPPDLGLPHDGVFALGPMNEAQWLHAELDFDKLAAVRAAGQVLNYRDWGAQQRLACRGVERVSLK